MFYIRYSPLLCVDRDLNKDGMTELLSRHRGSGDSRPIQESIRPMAPGRHLSGRQRNVEGSETDQSDTTETASQLSSNVGGWNEDPQVREKVRCVLRFSRSVVSYKTHTSAVRHRVLCTG